MKFSNRINKLFVATVIFPTCVSAIYFGAIASDQYTSVSKFMIRSPNSSGSSSLGGLIKGVGGLSPSSDDAYTVKNYITSRDAMNQLDKEENIRKLFSNKSIDFANRFAAADWDNSVENFYLYYSKNVIETEIDSNSPIITLNTHAYDPQLAWKINSRLLELSERMVNQMNEQARQDLISSAQRDVDHAQQNDRTATQALAQYRNDAGVIDPERQSSIPLERIGKLQDDLITTRMQIVQMERLSPANPELPTLRDRATLLQQAIDQTNQNITSGSGRSLASKAADFQRLTLEKEFADKILASAITSLEQARVEAERKQLYLERVAQPSFADHAMTPRRGRNIFATFMLGLILWGVLTIVIGGVKEHYDR